jgi:hypothetical protein
MTTVATSSADVLREILGHLDSAADGITAAARKFAAACDEDPTFAGFARDNAPWVRAQTWDALLSVGRGESDWRVAMGVAPHAALLSKLPVKTQTKLLDNGIDVPTGDGDTIRMQMCNMSATQARMAISGGSLRTPTEMVAASRTVKRSVAAPRRWAVRNGVLRVYEPCDITREELGKIMREVMK